MDDVSDKYSKIKKIGMEKADELRDELKNKWKELEEEVRKEEGVK